MDLLYINAYSVTRQYGGCEEGGWWYNHHSPLASIPIEAQRVDGHESYCYTCSQARDGKGEFCKVELYDEDGNMNNVDDKIFDHNTLVNQHLIPKDEKQVEQFVNHLKHIFEDEEYGDIYSVLGGAQLSIITETNPAKEKPSVRPIFE